MATAPVEIKAVQCCAQCHFNREGECRFGPPTVMWNDIEECVIWAHAPVPDEHWCGAFVQKYDT